MEGHPNIDIWTRKCGGAKYIRATFVEFNQKSVMSSRTKREDRTRVVTTRSIYHYVTCAICIVAYSHTHTHCGDETNTISKTRYWYFVTGVSTIAAGEVWCIIKATGYVCFQTMAPNWAWLACVITRFNFQTWTFCRFRWWCAGLKWHEIIISTSRCK